MPSPNQSSEITTDTSPENIDQLPQHVPLSILKTYLWRVAIFIGACIAVVLGFYIYKFNNWALSPDPAVWGQLGDFTGGLLNPLVSFATMVVVFVGVYYQRSELHATRLELKQSKQALKDSASAAIAHVSHLKTEEKRRQLELVINNIRDQVEEELGKPLIDDIWLAPRLKPIGKGYIDAGDAEMKAFHSIHEFNNHTPRLILKVMCRRLLDYVPDHNETEILRINDYCERNDRVFRRLDALASSLMTYFSEYETLSEVDGTDNSTIPVYLRYTYDQVIPTISSLIDLDLLSLTRKSIPIGYSNMHNITTQNTTLKAYLTGLSASEALR